MTKPVKRIEFSYQRSDLRHPDSGVQRLKGDNLVWWYGPIQKSPYAKSIPLVTVSFRRLYGDIPGAISYVDVPLSSLPHYRKGTIWREGQCISDTELEEEKFEVNFSPDGWSLTSRAQLHDEGMSHIFPDDDYPLKWGNRDQCKLINFHLPQNKNLLIPCTEYFVRAYARNMDVCRALATLTWPDVLSVLFENPVRSEYSWLVRPTPRMRNYDAVFLAHLLYDDYAAMRVKRINAQFISKSPRDKILLEAEPWFTGSGQILCRGKWINQGNTFLGLDLIGSNQPDGQEIEWQRLKFDSSGGVDGAGRLVLPRPVRTAAADELLTETSHAEPDNHAEITVVKAPPFRLLGKERKVKKTKHTVEADRSRVGPQPPSAETHSNGDGTGAGKNTGKLEHVSEAELESQGFLRDIWNAFKSIQEDNPERVSEVSWYTPDHGFNIHGSPKIILLTPIVDTSIANTVKAWVYLGRETVQRRGLMVLRIKVDGKNYFCFEVQREEPDGEKAVPGYSGVLMKDDFLTPKEFEDFVKKICSRVRYAMGRFKNMRSSFPVKTKIFKHTQKDQKVLYKNRLINVFKSLEVELK
ncbi:MULTISPECIES: hypothetical protein [unclassified Pseudomonas]|uniref:hypothetical protein n=1 Tax=unclassified Pseudomonas TaxID=196821 RepID=UPI0024472A2A|nr:MULTISPECIES: hypothetical protein [unclassified Pseudomonas]MDG9927971.1 hypothetical protein [Pseudomonas sp. GD04042]MDH0481980.1 hypothetical protein [Pseudomonas sp. GD04015]MDH0604125.1 hypothetical protein [Pseudomonas sp. GD03869]